MTRSTLPLLILLLCACDDKGGDLSGSLSNVYDLSFESVRARLYPSDLSIEFVNGQGEVVVRVTGRRAAREPSAGVKVDLVTEGDVTGTSGGVEIPRITRGTLTLTAFMAEQNARVEGRFDGVFAAGSTELSLTGNFSTRLEIVAER